MTWSLPYEFRFDSRTVRYGIEGKGADVVIVHGTPWSSYNMRHLIKALSGSFKVHFFDLMGYGLSDMSDGDVSLGIQNRLLDALIDHWGLNEPYIIGHDFGGATALRCLLLNRRNFKKMVLIDPVALAPWGSPFFSHVREHYEAFAGVPEYIQKAIVKAYIETAMYKPLCDETVAQTVEPWLGERGRQAFYRQIAQADQKFTDEVQSKYGEIDIPVLILWGREDVWIPVEKGYELTNTIPSSILKTVPDAGHLIIEEKPDALVKEITGFIRT